MDICIKCGTNPVADRLRSYRKFCEDCWAEMNRRRSESMKSKNITRSIHTRAKMAASHKVKRSEDPKLWTTYYQFFKDVLEKKDKILESAIKS